MQLGSKMRYFSAQLAAWLENDLWKELATHSNKMAQLLAEQVKSIPNIHVTQKVQSNGVFAIIPNETIEILQKGIFLLCLG